MTVRSYRDLIAWQKSMELVQQVYQATKTWPSEEQYGLTSQIRRAAISIASNIAEGHGRGSDRELVRFLGIAHGSLMEVETQLQIAHNLGYLSPDGFEKLNNRSAEIGRIIHGLIRTAKPSS
jgi:four helix bundle protein